MHKAAGVEQGVTRTLSLEVLVEAFCSDTAALSVCGSAGDTEGVIDTETQLLLHAMPLTLPAGLPGAS